MASRPRKGKGKRGTARTDDAQPTGFNALEIAEAGRSQYVLIDVRTENVIIAESPEAAYRQAAPERREGPFYLVRIGERAAFRSRRQPSSMEPTLSRRHA